MFKYCLPGVPDLDCPDSGLCCFNGCVNVCIHTTTQNITEDSEVLDYSSQQPDEFHEGVKPTYEDYQDIFGPLSEPGKDNNNVSESYSEKVDEKANQISEECNVVEQVPKIQCRGQRAECWSSGDQS